MFPFEHAMEEQLYVVPICTKEYVVPICTKEPSVDVVCVNIQESMNLDMGKGKDTTQQ